MKLLDVSGETFAVVEHLSAVVTLETLLRRELVHPFDVTAVGAHVTKRFVAVRALDTFSAFLKINFEMMKRNREQDLINDKFIP